MIADTRTERVRTVADIRTETVESSLEYLLTYSMVQSPS